MVTILLPQDRTDIKFVAFFTRVLFQSRCNFPKTIQSRLKIVNNLKGQLIRFGQIIQIGQALILQPKNIQTGFVACHDLIKTVFTPAAFRIVLFVPGFLTLMTIERVITGNEFLQILKA